MNSISSILFRGTQAQARQNIKKTVQTQGLCTVNFLYFAQAMKFKVYESETKSDYKTALLDSDLLCIDGIAMQIFDRVGQFFFGDKRAWTENLNGTDFLPYILEHTKNEKVAIIMSTVYDAKIGKGPEWMDRGLATLQALYPHIDIIFKHQTTFQNRGEDFPITECKAKINKVKDNYDHILFLNGIGGPAQEIWTEKNKHHFKDTGIVMMNNGATIDYYSGFETRAPHRVVKLRIGETLRRVITQPKKNLKKFLAMFAIVPYWGYITKSSLKKHIKSYKNPGK